MVDSLANQPCCGTRLCYEQVSVQIVKLAKNTRKHVFERNKSLCSQIAEIPFAFLSIKTRILLAVWKVVRLSGAGHLCRSDTVPGPGLNDNILVLTN